MSKYLKVINRANRPLRYTLPFHLTQYIQTKLYSGFNFEFSVSSAILEKYTGEMTTV